MSQNDIKALEREIYTLTEKLNSLKASAPSVEVQNHTFEGLEGKITLKEMFGNKDKLLVVHNMGQGCRYCTLWADGLNPFVSHLESAVSFVVVSKDDPETQRLFANSRNWRFRMYSHKNSDYMKEHNVDPSEANSPGITSYELKDGKIYKKNASPFGPNDLFCSAWSMLAMAGFTESNWSPQYSYWKRPSKLDDGGQNLID